MNETGDLSSLRKSYEKGLISDEFKVLAPFLFSKNGLKRLKKMLQF